MYSRTTTATLGALLLSFALAAATHAAPFRDVTYDLSDSNVALSIPALGTTTEIPAQGVFGVQTIRYTSDSAYGIATGPVELLSFNLYVLATVGKETYTPGGGTTFTVLNTAGLHLEFLSLTAGAAAGQRLPGGTVTPLGASGRFRLTGFIHCFTLCTALNLSATTPTALSPAVFTTPLPRLTGATREPQTVVGTATEITFELSPYAAGVTLDATGTLFLVGREVIRCPVGFLGCCDDDCPPVPAEPGTLPLLGAGLASLVASAAWRRRPRG